MLGGDTGEWDQRGSHPHDRPIKGHSQAALTTSHAPCTHAHTCAHAHTQLFMILDTNPVTAFSDAPGSSSLRMECEALPSSKSDL